MKQKIEDVRMPGVAIGNTMSRITLSREAPSIIAASSLSTGNASIKPLIIQITKGVTIAKFTIISAILVSRSPSERNIRKKGRTITTAGINWVERTKKNKNN